MTVISSLPADGRVLFSTRLLRLFGYGFLSVVMALYLAQVGMTQSQIGLLLTLTLLGDTIVSLYITTTADRIGRRRMLIIGALLMIFASIIFALTRNFYLLLFAATVGVISPSGNEVGPFLSIEQAALSHLISGGERTRVFAWYNLVGSFATATGALTSGLLSQALQSSGWAALDSYRVVVLGYGLVGLLLIGLFLRLSPGVEIEAAGGEIRAVGNGRGPAASSVVGGKVELSGNISGPTTELMGRKTPPVEAGPKMFLGLHSSKGIVLRLAALFSLDAFAGGFVIQSLVAYWFHIKFGVDPAVLGSIFFGANVLAGISALSAAWVARRIGLINTMVFTHLPSNVLLILVPLMPTLPLAIFMLLLRFSISQMDVPTRQSYTMAVVAPDERSAASGITGVARTIGASLSPVITGFFLANPALLALPFFLSGGLKIIYDLILYRMFTSVKPPEET